MFKLINCTHEEAITRFAKNINSRDITDIADNLLRLINQIHKDIPEKKRISYGCYNVVKSFGLYLYPLLYENNVNVLELASSIFENMQFDHFVRSLGTQLLSIYGECTEKLDNVLPVFEKAASDRNWILRECAAGFIRKLIIKYPDEMHRWYKMMVVSNDPMKRRFACESLRPVADNQWFRKNPEFVFPIIEKLYRESDKYPRTSIGNSLSDWMRIDEERTLKIVRQLAGSGDKNAYWIAYRACRNLVKKRPLLVMEILKTDRYVYKDRRYFRDAIDT